VGLALCSAPGEARGARPAAAAVAPRSSSSCWARARPATQAISVANSSSDGDAAGEAAPPATGLRAGAVPLARAAAAAPSPGGPAPPAAAGRAPPGSPAAGDCGDAASANTPDARPPARASACEPGRAPRAASRGGVSPTASAAPPLPPCGAGRGPCRWLPARANCAPPLSASRCSPGPSGPAPCAPCYAPRSHCTAMACACCSLRRGAGPGCSRGGSRARA